MACALASGTPRKQANRHVPGGDNIPASLGYSHEVRQVAVEAKHSSGQVLILILYIRRSQDFREFEGVAETVENLQVSLFSGLIRIQLFYTYIEIYNIQYFPIMWQLAHCWNPVNDCFI
jgi:hypothetical protein